MASRKEQTSIETAMSPSAARTCGHTTASARYDLGRPPLGAGRAGCKVDVSAYLRERLRGAVGAEA
eukprot:304707-Prymnesium_polylepis.1